MESEIRQLEGRVQQAEISLREESSSKLGVEQLLQVRNFYK